MADIVDRSTRSRMMAAVKNRNTAPELQIRRDLHRLGFRYKLHAADLPGCPDIVFPKYRAVIQVQGCFWHRHEGCRYCSTPTSNYSFWKKKFEENTSRDFRNNRLLLNSGWRIAIVWDCQLRGKHKGNCTNILADWLRGNETILEIPDFARKLKSGAA